MGGVQLVSGCGGLGDDNAATARQQSKQRLSRRILLSRRMRKRCKRAFCAVSALKDHAMNAADSRCLAQPASCLRTSSSHTRRHSRSTEPSSRLACLRRFRLPIRETTRADLA